MSRPRTPFGHDQPGRLAGTMIRVLATEMSDAGRLTRGKRYWNDRAVVDLVVGHGAVTAEVQGSRPLPYVVTIEARPGRKAPTRAEVMVRCTCPDDDGTGRSACKHAVAAMFALADEVSIDPDVLSRWRRSDTLPDDAESDDAEPDDDEPDANDHERSSSPEPDPRRSTRLRLVPDHDDDDDDDDDESAEARAIASLLDPGDGPRLPPVPTLAPADHPPFPDDLVDDVLRNTRSHLHVRWE